MSTLLEPTLQHHVPRALPGQSRPWRVGSQIYVAILGGPIAVTIIASLNARRLGMPARSRALIAAVGVVATFLAVGMIAAFDGEVIVGRIIGALAAGPMYLLARGHDRAYYAFSPEDEDEAYESLVVPGLGAVVAGYVLMGMLAASVAQ